MSATIPAGATIVSARWGQGKTWLDATQRLKDLINAGEPFVVNSKSMGGDPIPYIVKHLAVTYTLDGKEKSCTVGGSATFRPASEKASKVPAATPGTPQTVPAGGERLRF